ncbi:porin [Blastopirellula sp. J2-11]|uniref:porin n=1 Tax=Blastopirellula sp. J2-11 TaxID=2943192 RepID=UPI0021C6D4A4|nr:porin [Blastopirellula sp. J2-11]UUO08801.1 porin [Blastopirellula sp. J2-11]
MSRYLFCVALLFACAPHIALGQQSLFSSDRVYQPSRGPSDSSSALVVAPAEASYVKAEMASPDGYEYEVDAYQPACGTACGGCDTCCPQLCFDRFFIDGWLDQGFTGNPNASSSNGPVGQNGPLIFNDQANEYMMNQLYVSMGRALDPASCCWDIGGKIDLLYGTDYYFIQANGLETYSDGSQKWNSNKGPRNAGTAGLYGLAMPQAYVEVQAPIAGGVRVKMGHFYSILGYESVKAPENFFYSHTYIMQYGEPFTTTGVLASWDSSCCMTWTAGVTRGWNTWEQDNGSTGFMGGFNWTSPDQATKLRLGVMSGPEDPTADNNRTVLDIVLQQRLTCRWTYVMDVNYGTEDNVRVTDASTLDSASWYGIANYLYYEVNPCLDLGLRFEWFDDRDNARVFALPNDNITTGGSYYDLTLGANYHPNDWLIARPELRWDWSDLEAPGINGAFEDGNSKEQFTLGFDVIMVF